MLENITVMLCQRNLVKKKTDMGEWENFINGKSPTAFIFLGII